MVTRFGGPEVLEVADVAPPDPPGPDEILVEVEAAGVNPSDAKLRQGPGPLPDGRAFPYVCGREAAGVVGAAGPGVEGFDPGTPVFSFFGWGGRPGGHAEQVVVPVGSAAARPPSVPVADAAGVPLAGLTALQALRLLAPPPGATLLVTGGAGGVGCFAVQLAAEAGFEVVATASPANHAFLRQLGAADVLDYHDPGHVDAVTARGVHHLLDCVGPTTVATVVAALGGGGTVVAIAGLPPDLPASVDAHVMRAQPDGADLTELGRRLDAGALRSVVAATFPLEEAAAAHRRLEEGHVRGKLVLTTGSGAAPG